MLRGRWAGRSPQRPGRGSVSLATVVAAPDGGDIDLRCNFQAGASGPAYGNSALTALAVDQAVLAD